MPRPGFIKPLRLSQAERTPPQAPPSRHNVLDTLEMLRGMGYKDVWVRADEAPSGTVQAAGKKGWVVADVDQGRIKFTLRGPNDFALDLDEAAPSERPGSPSSSRRSLGSYHTVGGSGLDMGSPQGTHSPSGESTSSRYGRHHSESSGVSGRFRYGTHLSPQSPALSSPGGVSPSASLGRRETAPELRLESPEGVVGNPARPESLWGQEGVDYFTFRPRTVALPIMPEQEEGSPSPPASQSAPPTVSTVPVPLPPQPTPRAPKGKNTLTFEALEAWIPVWQGAPSPRELAEFDQPRRSVVSHTPSTESVYSQKSHYGELDDEAFEFDAPRKLSDLTHAPTQMPQSARSSPGEDASYRPGETPSLRQVFRPPTPELRIPPKKRRPSRTQEVLPEMPLRTERFDSSATDATAKPDSSETLPLLPKRWQCRDT